MIKRTEEEQKIADKQHAFYKGELYKRELSNSEAYDKAILSLSSAGLAISLTFIKFIVPLDKAVHLVFLKSSWILFLLSVTFVICSFLVGNKAIQFHLECAEQYYIDGKADALCVNLSPYTRCLG
ncbi:MAG: hypothetical protein K0U59_03625 [Gammaproteobacteria bacterium]|nr:hypothetical protein [Gammaproteobacteria bacterium]